MDTSLKFVLLKESIEFEGQTLFRIQALHAFGSVEAGDLGGFVASEESLSQTGLCWVGPDARVAGGGRVFDDARLYQESVVAGSAIAYNGFLMAGTARLDGDALGYGQARMRGRSKMRDGGEIFGEAMLEDDVTVAGQSTVSEDARLVGNRRVFNEHIRGQNVLTNGAATSASEEKPTEAAGGDWERELIEDEKARKARELKARRFSLMNVKAAIGQAIEKEPRDLSQMTDSREIDLDPELTLQRKKERKRDLERAAAAQLLRLAIERVSIQVRQDARKARAKTIEGLIELKRGR